MIVPIHGPARGTSTPGAFKPRRAFSMPVSSFPRPHSSWHDRAESATPDGSDPTLSNNWVPAERRIQSISVGWIIGLWRAAFGVATERQLGAIEHFGLWVSPCGLAFFEPMLAGDADFYLDLYRKGEFHRILTAPGLARAEFRRVAELVQPGDKVLDVGCGEGGLARHLPHATYVGLDPIFSPVAEGTDVRNETIAEHAASHPGQYDAVCAFHVIEHVTDPLGFGRDLVQCTRPGERIYIAVPVWGSAITDIPNFVFNAPPHHLSWWNETSLHTLADRLDLIVEGIEPAPFSLTASSTGWVVSPPNSPPIAISALIGFGMAP